MEAELDELPEGHRRSPDELARALVGLYDDRFGGAPSGRFRVSRKFLRKLAGRRRLPDTYLNALAEEVFEMGFVFVDCESYSVVLSQKQFASYRRVTALAVNRVTKHENDKGETNLGQAEKQTPIVKVEEGQAQIKPEIH